jgi:hypothetical protein
VLVNYVREYQLEHGVPRAEVYSFTMYVLAGLLAVGFICNLMIQPVAKQHYMTRAQLAALDAADAASSAVRGDTRGAASAAVTPMWIVAAAWLAVGIPIAWGVWVTLLKAAVMFSQG